MGPQFAFLEGIFYNFSYIPVFSMLGGKFGAVKKEQQKIRLQLYADTKAFFIGKKRKMKKKKRTKKRKPVKPC